MLRLFRSSKSSIIAQFFNAPEHRWAWRNEIFRKHLVELFMRLSGPDLHSLTCRRRLLLLYSDARMSCAFHQFRGREIVLVFPDLLRLMISRDFTHAQAILAHEFGHIVLGHAHQAIHDTRAQLEADRFAASLGFGEDLAQVLEDYASEEQISARIIALQQSR